jgi:hypothetical protein
MATLAESWPWLCCYLGCDKMVGGANMGDLLISTV